METFPIKLWEVTALRRPVVGKKLLRVAYVVAAQNTVQVEWLLRNEGLNIQRIVEKDGPVVRVR